MIKKPIIFLIIGIISGGACGWFTHAYIHRNDWARGWLYRQGVDIIGCDAEIEGYEDCGLILYTPKAYQLD